MKKCKKSLVGWINTGNFSDFRWLKRRGFHISRIGIPNVYSEKENMFITKKVRITIEEI